MSEKTLHNSDVSETQSNVSDIKVVGAEDMFGAELLCTASSKAEGWVKTTKAMEIPRIGCIVQVTTQRRNPDGSYAIAEALTFVPQVKIVVDPTCGSRHARKLADMLEPTVI